MNRIFGGFVLILMMFAAFSPSAQAASVLNLSNLPVIGTIDANTTTINFQPNAPIPNCSPGGGNTGIFTGLILTCSVKDFANSTSATSPGFLTMTGANSFVFNLLGVVPASGPAIGSTVSLVQLTSNTVVASIGLWGNGTKNGNPFEWQGALSTQFSGTIAEAIMNGLTPNSSFSLTANDTAQVPEPSIFIMLGTALTSLGVFARRRKQLP